MVVLGVFAGVAVFVLGLSTASGRRSGPSRVTGRRRPDFDLHALTNADANFSVPALLDFAVALFARVHESRPGGLDTVRSWVSEAVLSSLAQRSNELRQLNEVIVGSIETIAGGKRPGAMEVQLGFVANWTETPKNGEPVQVYVEELWTLRKSSAQLSPAPDKLVALACPNCGSPGETHPDGRCTRCDAVVGDGKWMWQVVRIDVNAHEPVGPPELSSPGAVESGTQLPTVLDADLALGARALMGRNPDFEPEDFRRRVSKLFLEIQRAWSDGTWERARPWVSDHLYQTQRFWQRSNQRAGLRNRLDRVAVQQVELVKVTTDAWYESVTVRVRATMADWMEDAQGTVVQGSKDQTTQFSEYWTFIRALGRAEGPDHDPLTQCPACGAPLDRVGETGVCGYCEATITGGGYDWVLSRIEQDDVYQG